MNKVLADYLDREAEARKLYDAASQAGDEAGVQEARAMHRQLTADLEAAGLKLRKAYSLMDWTRERYTVKDGPVLCEHEAIEEVSEALNAGGLKKVYFADGWSSAIPERLGGYIEAGWQVDGFTWLTEAEPRWPGSAPHKIGALILTLKDTDK